MSGRILKACTRCGARMDRCRCPQRAPRSGTYTRDARRVVEHALASRVLCHLCGKPFTSPDDPPVADHVIPRSRGGTDDLSNLKAAHRSCNARKGADMVNGTW